MALKQNLLFSHWYLSPDDHALILGNKIQTEKIHLTQKLQPELLHYQNLSRTFLITYGSHNLLYSVVYHSYLEFVQNWHRIKHNKRWGTYYMWFLQLLYGTLIIHKHWFIFLSYKKKVKAKYSFQNSHRSTVTNFNQY